ncbi:UDP-N-acetylmuramate--L-alanine ligase [Tenacibaculum sp. IB213877]|uniref:UDP-N-acetylmuramate--L-alanine ligase n=1 Tax=Tenacibaculum sp. IB213877 TaxID=3097351 RepID=UPI002A5AD39D|nr:UDP-N-acetylmuramate--L-alanine ligase [Tenacibaculum sp. IB213877]MDY0780734.1 UDP-N-acetylmuramate--L-alanine ligase [Tenacibaculum sp. IB213877]
MKLSSIHNVYFVGIGGIGMSALAQYFAKNGKKVAGYDKTPTPITNALKQSNIEVHFKDEVKNIPISFLNEEQTLVVYTPAIPKDHLQLNYFQQNGFTVMKRAEVLGKITENTFCLAVAGTHGKTTTSSILGHIMQPSKATAFLGGIAENYNSNLILGEDKISVVEADEFDRSFLQLSPNIACVTSMDADHLDIYGEHEMLLQSFRDFAGKVSDTLIVAKGLPLEGLTYAVNENADYKAFNVKIVDGAYIFDVQTPTEIIENIEFRLPGKHNMMNALAALAMADVYGVSSQQIKEQLSSFDGVQRRFSYKLKSEDVVLIDDYAHHPTEIAAVENSVREMYPNDKVVAVFQPHLFSRTRDFAEDFAAALSKFDEIILLNIYPARELPIQGITSEWLLDKIENPNKKLSTKQNLIKNIQLSNSKVVVMIGAGDIGLLVDDVKKALEKRS